MKSCFKCGEEKPLDDFGNRARSRDKKNGTCRSCAREYFDGYRHGHRQKIRESSAKYRSANLEVVKRRIDAWKASFPERQRQSERNYRANHPDRRKASQDLYKSKPGNSEKEREAQRSWAKRNRAKIAAKAAHRRSMKLMATPSWADMDAIFGLYEEAKRITAETGVQYEVDHIYPLKSKWMCGLHVETNLRIITAAENRRKGNKIPRGV